MKTLKFIILNSAIILLFSCSKDTNVSAVTEFKFTISQNVENIQEFDTAIFNIENNGNANISYVTWYIDNVEKTNDFAFEKYFEKTGNFNLKAKIFYENSLTKTIEKTIIVAERPKNLVTINKIELLSYAYNGQFYLDGHYYVKLKFDLRELDETGNSIIKYLSTENTENWNQGGPMVYPIIWNTSNANYKVKVYKTGNYYPNNQEYYHTDLSLFAAKSNGLTQQPYYQLNNLKLDLNPYRSLKPSSITITNIDTEIRLTLQWD